MFGCSSSWHVRKAKEKCPECFTSDTTINEVVFRLDTVINIDTTIKVILPRDTVRIEKLIPKNVYFEPIYQKNGIINVEVFIEKGELNIVSYLDSAMLYDIEMEIEVKDSIIIHQSIIIDNQYNDIQKKDKWIDKAKKWGKIAIIIIGLIISLLIVVIIIRIIKWGKKK
jgi:hypothetical protein